MGASLSAPFVRSRPVSGADIITISSRLVAPLPQPQHPAQLESNGAKTGGVRMVQTRAMNWGLTASRDVDEGARLARLPRRLQLSYRHDDGDDDFDYASASTSTPPSLTRLIDQVPADLWSAKLGLALLRERALGAKSRFAPYVRLLPAAHQARSHSHWSP